MSEDDFLAIQEQYRQKCLIEELLGPMVSMIVHVMVIIILAIVVTDELVEPVVDVEMTVVDLLRSETRQTARN